MRDYRNIKVYKLADALVTEIYKITKKFPKEELYGLTSQLRRAALSVVTNIVEGSSRKHKQSYLNFLYISRGSIAETGYLLELAYKLGYMKEKEYENLRKAKEETAKALYGLIKTIQKQT
jgi:four helix bundle protein